MVKTRTSSITCNKVKERERETSFGEKGEKERHVLKTGSETCGGEERNTGDE